MLELPRHSRFDSSSLMCIREEMEYDVEGDTEPYRVRREEGEPEVNRCAGDWITLHLFSTLFWLVERHQSAFAFLKNGGMKWAEKVRHLTPEALASSARLSTGGGGIKAILANKHVPQLVREALDAMQMAFADVLGTDGHRRLCRHEGVAYMQLFGPPVIFCTPNLADTRQVLLLVVQGMEIRLDDADLAGVDLPRYRDMMQRLARDPVGQTRVFELIMRLFFVHLLGVRPECVHGRRRVKVSGPREWCTDGVAAASAALGIVGPVRAFRGEIEAQGRGSLHPHILVWLICMLQQELLRILAREPNVFKQRVAEWMKATVLAVQSTCQSSVKALPRQFGNVEGRQQDLPFSRVERKVTEYDGGSEHDALRAAASRGMTLSEEQEAELATGDPDSWLRPSIPIRDKAGMLVAGNAPEAPRESVYSKRLNEFAASACPSFRRLGTVGLAPGPADAAAGSDADLDADATPAAPSGVEIHGLDADAWELQFGEDVRRLASEILIHICGDSCYKYSGSKMTQICRHGFYYVVVVASGNGLRRRGKALRNALFIMRENKFSMQGRLLLFQEHPFECQSNYGALDALRCNFDMQDLRRVLPEDDWLDEELPHLGNRPDFGYMNAFEWSGTEWEPRRPDSSDASYPRPDLEDAPNAWSTKVSAESWRKNLLECLNSGATATAEQTVLQANLEREVNASFGDGLNTGFYINAYTTKHCPTMDGVLEEMRKGLERLGQTREEARLRYEEDLHARAASDANGSTGSIEPPPIVRKKATTFGQTLEVLKRLSASYRRCYWKSGSEMLFPIMFGHMTEGLYCS